MSELGFVKLHRKTLENSISKNLEFLGLFSALLLKASFKEKEFYLGYTKVNIKPGQFVSSIRKLALEFKVSTNKMYRMLDVLKVEHIVEHQGCGKYSLFTIVNRHKYQVDRTQDRTVTEHIVEQEWNTIKNDNNIEETIDTPPAVDYNILWMHFPHARKARKAHTLKYLAKLDYNDCLYAIKILKWEAELGLQDTKFIPGMELRARDFVKLADAVNQKKLLAIYKLIKEAENIKENIVRFVEDFGEEKTQALYAIVEKQKKDKFISSIYTNGN